MADPIKLSNVNFAAQERAALTAGRLFDGASSSLDNAGRYLSGVLSQGQAQVTANENNAKANNDFAFKEYLEGFKTPDELQNAKDSGAVDAFKANLGGRMSKELRLNGFDTALKNSRAEATANYEYGQTVGAQITDPIMSKLEFLYQGGKETREEYDNFLATHVDTLSKYGLSDDLGRITQGIDDANTTRDRADFTHNIAVQNEKRAAAGRRATDEIFQLGVNDVAGQEALDTTITERLSSAAMNYNIMQPDGTWTPADNVSPESRKQWQSATSQIMGASKTQRELRSDFREKLNRAAIANPDGYTQQKIDLAMAAFDKRQIELFGYKSPEETAQITKELAVNENLYTLSSNSFTAQDQSTVPTASTAVTTLNNLIKKNKDIEKLIDDPSDVFNNTTSEALRETITNAIMNGHPNSAGVIERMPPAMVELALTTFRESDWWVSAEKERSPDDLLTNFLSSKGYQKEWSNYVNGTAEKTRISTQFDTSPTRLIDSFTAGMPAPSPYEEPKSPRSIQENAVVSEEKVSEPVKPAVKGSGDYETDFKAEMAKIIKTHTDSATGDLTQKGLELKKAAYRKRTEGRNASTWSTLVDLANSPVKTYGQ